MEDFCENEIDYLSKEVESLTNKSKQLKLRYHQLLVKNLQKDVEIAELQQKVKDAEKKTNEFADLRSKLTATTLKQIKMLSGAQQDDSTFVYLILNDIYGDSLANKTISGRSKNVLKFSENSAISHKNMNTLRQLLEKRLEHLSAECIDSRMALLNKHIRTAIDKSKRRKLQMKETEHVIEQL